MCQTFWQEAYQHQLSWDGVSYKIDCPSIDFRLAITPDNRTLAPFGEKSRFDQCGDNGKKPFKFFFSPNGVLLQLPLLSKYL